MAEPRNVPQTLMTIDDVAALCRVSSKTVRRWIKTRELTAAQLGAQGRLRPRDLDLFIHERMER